MLLFREGITDWGFTSPSILALYDWRTNESTQLTVPDLNQLSDVAQGPDSNTIAYTTFPDDRVVLFDVRHQTARTITTGQNPAFAPDGNRLAIWRANKLVIIDLNTQHEEVVQELTDPGWYQGNLSICCMVWSPDGARLAYHLTNEVISGGKIQVHAEQIVVFDLQTRLETIAASDKFLQSPSWSPNGKFLSYIDGAFVGTALLVMDVMNRCAVGKLQIDDLYSAFWSPEGNVIAIVYSASSLYFVDVKRVFGGKTGELKCP